jgi:hypothetical protein
LACHLLSSIARREPGQCGTRRATRDVGNVGGPQALNLVRAGFDKLRKRPPNKVREVTRQLELADKRLCCSSRTFSPHDASRQTSPCVSPPATTLLCATRTKPAWCLSKKAATVNHEDLISQGLDASFGQPQGRAQAAKKPRALCAQTYNLNLGDGRNDRNRDGRATILSDHDSTGSRKSAKIAKTLHLGVLNRLWSL